MTLPASPSPILSRLALAAALCLAAASARADGLSDLKAALARLTAQTPARASLELRTFEQRGTDDDMDEKVGLATVQLEDGPHGLQVCYGRDTLNRIQHEQQAVGRDAKAKTPTMFALARFDQSEAPDLLQAVPSIERSLEDSQYKGERVDAWQGKPARVLSFEVPMTRVPSQQRKYVKDFDGLLEIWIAGDGTPLGSRLHANVQGRAFLVVTFDAQDEEDTAYAVTGDRLVTTHRDVDLRTSGAGERGEQHVIRNLTLLP